MPKVAYSEEDRERIRTALITVGLDLMAKQGIQHTTVEQIYKTVGISRTFFYSFFPTKEDLVVETLYWQQPKILAYVRRLMADPALSWRDAVRQFLHACCYGERNGIAVLTLEEQQLLFKRLSEESCRIFRQKQFRLFQEILEGFGVKTDEKTVWLFTNLSLAVMVIRRALPDTLPLLVSEAVDETVDFQIDAIVDALEKRKKASGPICRDNGYPPGSCAAAYAAAFDIGGCSFNQNKDKLTDLNLFQEEKIMGLFSKLFKGPEIDMEKSRANAAKMRALFDQAVKDGDDYRLIFGYTEDVSRFNYGFVHGSKTKIGNLIVGWNEASETIVVVPTVPDLSGCGDPTYYRRPEILKAYRNKYPTDAFIIYPDRKGYIGINAYDWLEDEKLYVYVSQEEELAAFTDFFMNRFAKK